ncbi:uncharacterized protein RBU57_008131 [Macrochelys suwanniensis]
MASCTSVVQHARLRLQPLQAWLASVYRPGRDNLDMVLTVPARTLDSLQWWLDPLIVGAGVPFQSPHPSLTLVTDASALGWGAHLGDLTMQGMWQHHELDLHINIKELRAIRLACQAFLPYLRDRCVLPPWSSECPGGQAEQMLPRPRMVHTPRRDPFDLPYLGVSPTRPVCLTNQQEVPDLLLLQRTQLGLSCGRFRDPVVTPPALRVSAFSIDPQGPSQESQGQGERHLSGPCLGMAVLVPDPDGSVNTAPHSSPNQSRPHLTRSRSSSPSGPPLVTSHSVEDSRLNRTELACSAPVRQVLLESRKPSTRLTYEAKWKRFSVWCAQEQISPLLAPVPSILDYILHLKDNHFALGSLKVHLAAISAFHPGADGRSIFAHPMALLCDPPYTIFHKDKVQLRPHPSFLPKVVSRFHMSQDIFLPVFFPKPHANSREQRLHSLDVRRALAFYIERTRPFHKMPQLFVTVAERMKGALVSSQRIFSWITACIHACYDLAKVSPPVVTAHSIRAQASSAAFLANVPLQESCRAATWASVHTFTSHYAIIHHSRDDTAFDRAILQSALP